MVETVRFGLGTIPPPAIASATVSKRTFSPSFDMDMPAVRPDGDLYMAYVAVDEILNITVPGTWTPVYELTHSDPEQIALAVYTWIGSSEPATYGLSGDAGSSNWAGAIVRITNIDPTTPVNVSASAVSSSHDTPTNPSVTPTVDGTLVLFAMAITDDRLEDEDIPSGTALAVTVSSPFPDVSLGIASGLGTKNGPTGTRPWIKFDPPPNLSDAWITVTAAVAPAP